MLCRSYSGYRINPSGERSLFGSRPDTHQFASKNMKRFIPILAILLPLLLQYCKGQNQARTSASGNGKQTSELVGGPFENADFHYIGMPKTLDAVDTSPGWPLPAAKILIRGKILQPDGKTPAPGVILYYYQTNDKGLYADNKSLDRRVVRHGYIRGWVKSDEAGCYSIYTIRPAPYPGGTDPAHIHPSILEPGLPNPYYIDEFVFDDDPLLTPERRQFLENRGGSGILRLVRQDSLWVGERDIILGLHIPHYPGKTGR